MSENKRTITTVNSITKHLYRNNQKLTDNNVEAVLNEAREKEIQFLDLSQNQFTRLHLADIEPLNDVEVLEISYNKKPLQEVVLSAAVFPKIKYLYLYKSQIQKITLQGTFKHLKAINLYTNNLQEFILPNAAAHTALESIELKGNDKLGNPPVEIASQDGTAVVRYLKEIAKQGAATLYEAKMLIVGQGGAGKTSFYTKLVNQKNKLPLEEQTTRGIDIHTYTFTFEKPISSEENKQDADEVQNRQTNNPNSIKLDFILHIWDFGGQHIYHATHQFFLTKDSIYVLIIDNRQENQLFGSHYKQNIYWLEVQQLFGGNSPLIIVQNERQDRKIDLPIKDMRERFPNISKKHFGVNLNLVSNEAINTFLELKSYIEEIALGLPHIGKLLPAKWVQLREDLKTLVSQKNYIGRADFYSLCTKHDIKSELEIKDVSRTLHNLGIILHFQDDVLLDSTVFLKNTWVTDAVYAIIDGLNNQTKHEKWKFTNQDAIQILCQSKYERIYQDKVPEVIKLMEKFDLCYQLSKVSNKEEYIIPQLLPPDRPETADKQILYRKENARIIQVKYEYKFMPKGILSRLMVRLSRYLYKDPETQQQVVWNSGMILHYPSHNVYAEVVETYGEDILQIWVSGGEDRSVMSLIADEIDDLNRTFGNHLDVAKLIPCICSTCRQTDKPHFYDYQELLERREIKKTTIECKRKPYNDVEVDRLINNVFLTNLGIKTRRMRVFISYSKADAKYLTNFLNHLAPLKHEGLIEDWTDRELLPGEEWDKTIQRKILDADIILLLISANALATDYIVSNEMKIAMRRHDNAEAVVVPIIVRPCVWDLMPFARLNALPEKGKPVTSFTDQNEAWLQVVNKLRPIIKGQINLKSY